MSDPNAATDDWPGYVTARLWDVNWREGGVGKHGRGPFATRRQAEACLRAVGFEGEVELSLWTVTPARLNAIKGRGLRKGIPEAGTGAASPK
jgi:hypothetical protein